MKYQFLLKGFCVLLLSKPKVNVNEVLQVFKVATILSFNSAKLVLSVITYISYSLTDTIPIEKKNLLSNSMERGKSFL